MTFTTEDDIPDEFICPITNEIMKNPLMSVHGFNFERDAIFEWLQKHSTCPLSRKELSISKLVTNCALKEKIHAWCEAYDMMHLLQSDSNEDDDPDDPRHRVLGIRLTEKQERQLRNFQAKRQRRVRRALSLFSRHGTVEVRRALL